MGDFLAILINLWEFPSSWIKKSWNFSFQLSGIFGDFWQSLRNFTYSVLLIFGKLPKIAKNSANLKILRNCQFDCQSLINPKLVEIPKNWQKMAKKLPKISKNHWKGSKHQKLITIANIITKIPQNCHKNRTKFLEIAKLIFKVWWTQN